MITDFLSTKKHAIVLRKKVLNLRMAGKSYREIVDELDLVCDMVIVKEMISLAVEESNNLDVGV